MKKDSLKQIIQIIQSNKIPIDKIFLTKFPLLNLFDLNKRCPRRQPLPLQTSCLHDPSMIQTSLLSSSKYFNSNKHSRCFHHTTRWHFPLTFQSVPIGSLQCKRNRIKRRKRKHTHTFIFKFELLYIWSYSCQKMIGNGNGNSGLAKRNCLVGISIRVATGILV